MKRKLLALLLAAALLIGAAPAALAAASADDMLEVLAALGVMNGDENGNLNLDQSVTRAQFTKMAVAASGGSAESGGSGFADVPDSHWASGYVAAASEAKLLSGYPDGSFRPDGTVTMAEAATVMLKLLGYVDSDFGSDWSKGVMALASLSGLTAGVSAKADDGLTRRQCAQLVYNTLLANTREGRSYAAALGLPLDSGGNIDTAELVKSVTEGPVVVQGASWADGLGFEPLYVYVNGEKAQKSDVRSYDVVYYSRNMLTVWAVRSSVTGTLESVAPNAASPSSVTVDGASYELGTASASLAVSQLGSFSVGDSVALLLGSDGKVAAVVAGETINSGFLGVVTAAGTETYESPTGDRYVRGYITITATDGISRKFALASAPEFSRGDIVSVSESGDAAAVTAAEKSALSGTFSADGSALGGARLAANAEILDVYGSAACTLTARRLANVAVKSGDVLAAEYNSAGEISRLVLNDVSGDAHSYGLLTEKNAVPSEDGTRVYYSYISGGVSVIYPSDSYIGGSAGGVRIDGSVSAPTGMTALKSGVITSFGASSAVIDGVSFSFTSALQIYRVTENGYAAEQLANINTQTERLVGWYDDLPQNGGALRIVVVG